MCELTEQLNEDTCNGYKLVVFHFYWSRRIAVIRLHHNGSTQRGDWMVGVYMEGQQDT